MAEIFDDIGSGPAVVFLHAGCADRRMWYPQWDHLVTDSPRARRRVRVDSPGFGERPVPAGEFSRAESVLELLDDLDIETAVLVGASMGCRTALEIAVSAPSLVDGLLLLAPSLGQHGEWSPEVVGFWESEEAALAAGDIDTTVRLNVEFWLDGHGRAASTVNESDRTLVAGMQRRAFEHDLAAPPEAVERHIEDLAARVSGITAPTVVVFGTHDIGDFAERARWLATELPHAELHEIAGTAHLPSLECPDAVNALLDDLLERIGR